MNNRMTIIEYERVYRKGDNSISALQFDKVEEFILQNIDNNGERLLIQKANISVRSIMSVSFSSKTALR